MAKLQTGPLFGKYRTQCKVIFSFLVSLATPGYIFTSEDLELVKSDVRPHARFPILHLVLSLNMIVSSVIHCKAHDAIFFKHLR